MYDIGYFGTSADMSWVWSVRTPSITIALIVTSASASEMTYIVSGGALNSTHSLVTNATNAHLAEC